LVQESVPVRCFHSLILVALLLFATAQAAQQLPADTLAEVGGKAITTKDLFERLELMPWPGKEHREFADSVKIRALQSLVAEQLLALESSTGGVLRDSTWAMRIRMLEQLMVRDQLYRRHVLTKVTISDGDIREGIRRYSSSLRLLTFVVRTEADARKLYRIVSRGPIDSIARRIPSNLLLQQDTITINFGDIEKPAEDAIYHLEPQHAAQPMFLRWLGWTVIALLEKKPNPKYWDKSVAERLEAVRSTLKQQKELDEAARYQTGLLSPRKAEANPEVFNLLAFVALNILRGDSSRYHHQGGYSLADILDSLMTVLAPELNRSFIVMEPRDMTLWEVLEGYRYLRFEFPSLKEADFRARLNGSIKEIVGDEYLVRQGYKENLQNSSEVRHDVATWVDYWNARLKERQLQDSVGTVDDEDILSYLIEEEPGLGREFEVNVREILSDSLQSAARLVQQIIGGADMATLAKKLSKRSGWSERGGESSWFCVSAFPKIGFRALVADTGQLVGPIRLNSGYSIFQVLGKRRANSTLPVPVDSLKTLVRPQVARAKLRQLINRRIAANARIYGVKIHYDRLRNFEISTMNMVTRRTIGFGGTVIAVPTVVPHWEWVDEAKDLKDVLP
jgi:parvulin-like peptidyl-prolyl isomerase